MNNTTITSITATKPAIRTTKTITTHYGDVVVVGAEMVGTRLLEILGTILNMPEVGPLGMDHGVSMVVFRNDDFITKDGRAVLANCCPEHRSIGINLVATLAACMEDVLEHPQVSIVGSFHRNIIGSYLHEMSHLRDLARDPSMGEAALELRADHWVVPAMNELAKKGLLEPNFWGDIPFLRDRLPQTFLDDSEFSHNQRHMLNKGLLFNMKGTERDYGLSLWTFKQFCHLMSKESPRDESWGEALYEAMMACKEAEQARREVVVPPTKKEEPTVICSKEFVAAVEQQHAEQHKPTPQPLAEVKPMLEAITEAHEMRVEVARQEAEAAGTMTAQDMEYMSLGDDGPTSYEYEDAYIPEEIEPYSPPAAPYTPPPPQQPVAQPTKVVPHKFPIFNAATATPAVQAQPVPAMAPAISKEELQRVGAIAQRVYMKMYEHIFTHCGMQVNSDTAFANPKAVIDIPLVLDAEERAVITHYDGYNKEGRFSKNIPIAGDGEIRGDVKPHTQLPCYKFTVKAGTMVALRLLLPQNVTKDSAPAKEARAGHAIAWVIDSNEETKDGRNKWQFKIRDGVIEYVGSGSNASKGGK